MKKSCVFLFLVVFLGVVVSAGPALGQNEQYQISGRILDSDTGVGAEGVAVEVFNSDFAPVGDPVLIDDGGDFVVSTGGRGPFSVCIRTDESDYLPPSEEDGFNLGCRQVMLTIEAPEVSLGEIYLTPKELPPPPIQARFEVWPKKLSFKEGKNLWGTILPSMGFDPADLDLSTIRIGPAVIKPCAWRVRVCKKIAIAIFVGDVTRLGLNPEEDVELCFSAKTFYGRSVKGCDNVFFKKPRKK